MYWSDVQAAAGGTATFSPTSNEGAALFSHIYAVQFTAQVNTNLPIGVALCGLKSISADRKTVVANVVIGTTLLSLGATLLGASDGTLVHCFIMGD